MIKAKNITKKFGNVCALDGFNMNVEKGSIYGLIGPNGAGKTTIINHLAGVLKSDEGSIEIDGKPIIENNEVKQKVLCINDEWYYFAGYTVKEMAKFYKSMYHSFNQERYDELGKQLNISENIQIRSLSKGMKKQVAFRIVLSCMPDVLILDEPLDGLDPVMRKRILNIIISDVAEREMTVLVSSHNLRELEDLCDHVGIIHKGKMIIERSLNDLKGNILKLQLAFKEEFPEEITSKLNILHHSETGSVHTLIVKGDDAEIAKFIDSFSPVLCDRVKLTLEEVFIYELGGLGYDFESIIV